MPTYANTPRGIRAEQLIGFFVGWPTPPTPERHLELLRGSDAVVVAIDEQLEHLYMVDLCCDAELEPFYTRLGFRTLDRAMGLRRRENI